MIYTDTMALPAAAEGWQVIEEVGRGARIRTADLLRPRLDLYVYLVDFAARLATYKDQKARQKRSSGTDLVLVCFRFRTRVLRS